MEAIITEPDWNVVGIVGAARGGRLAAEAEAIGTEHLLAGISGSKGAAREALANEGATQTALAAVLRDRLGRDDAWSGADGAEQTADAQDLLGDVHGDKRDRFTGAAARALTSAREQAEREGAAKFSAVHLLRALLDEEDNRATETLAACGIPPQAVRDRLDGGTGSAGGPGGQQDAGLTPLLHPTRDILLGRDHYRHLSFWKRWLIKSAGTNLASKPAWWVALETYEQAHRLGHRKVGTEHVLLAVLATHEVALRYPHLTKEGAPTPDTRYAGGERLAGLGLDYASLHSALTGDRVRLTASDARPVKQYVEQYIEEYAAGTEPGTGPLVESLLREETRARHLVDNWPTR